MQTIINNDERIFYVYSANNFGGKAVVCNVKDLKKAIEYVGTGCKVQDNWNHNFKKLTNKQVNEILAANP